MAPPHVPQEPPAAAGKGRLGQALIGSRCEELFARERSGRAILAAWWEGGRRRAAWGVLLLVAHEALWCMG